MSHTKAARILIRYKLNKRPFLSGLLGIFGLNTYKVEYDHDLPAQKLYDDFRTIAHDFNNVFEKESHVINEQPK